MRKFLILLAVFLVILFAGCSNNKPETETTTDLTTVETTEETTEKETEESTTKAPETTKPKPQPTQKPTEAPKPTEKPTEKPTQPKPTEPKPTKPSGGGLDTWNEEPLDPGGYVQDPDTDGQYWVDKEAEDLGENLDWELN